MFACSSFRKSRSPCRKKRIFKNNKKKQKQETDPIIVLKAGPIMLRNILGPFLTQAWTKFNTRNFVYFVCFSFVLDETPIF